MTRPSMDEIFLKVAMTVAERSTCTTKRKVGAVLVDPSGFFIVSTGYNGAPSGMPHCDDVGCTFDETGSCVSVVHAELNCLLQCASRGVAATGGVLYTTCFPCPRCAMAIAQVRLSMVAYLDVYQDKDDFARARKILVAAGIATHPLDYVYAEMKQGGRL